MEAAAVASSGSGLRYLSPLDPAPKQQRSRNARVVGFVTKWRQPRAAVACRRPHRVHAAAARDGGGAGDSSSGSGGVRSKKRLAVFVPGGGSNFRSIHEATAVGGKVDSGDVVALVTEKPGCGGAEYARRNGIQVVLFPMSKSAPEGVSTAQLLNVLRYSGPTVHFVDEHFDTGRTVAQRVVPVLANDTPEQLAARVLHEEHHVYVEAVAVLCEDRIVWQEDGVPLIRTQTNPDAYA